LACCWTFIGPNTIREQNARQRDRNREVDM
jgi:hypothetical protein